MSLQEKLNKFRKDFESGGPPLNVSPDIIAKIHKATDELRDSGIIERILKADDKAPEFSLPNANGEIIHSKDLLAKGNLVISFYRGGW
jgi:hypothetical protein